jgi:hypothetical protein
VRKVCYSHVAGADTTAFGHDQACVLLAAAGYRRPGDPAVLDVLALLGADCRNGTRASALIVDLGAIE